jgi:hypothetical protein
MELMWYMLSKRRHDAAAGRPTTILDLRCRLPLLLLLRVCRLGVMSAGSSRLPFLGQPAVVCEWRAVRAEPARACDESRPGHVLWGTQRPRKVCHTRSSAGETGAPFARAASYCLDVSK